MSRIGIFKNLINELPLNARIYFVINNNTVYVNNIRFTLLGNILTITTIETTSGDYFLHSITEVISNNNLGNDVPIQILNYGTRYYIDIVDTSTMDTDGRIRFHLIRS